ncbi:trichothecene efflux pump [Lepidopterella palustris CBS 459.81]|uniref:Trichothecene efflux pump n=1 Tax=Lepidopterella palustris CBS 459.81 TaxID=1314670 RepID=A0A8E2DXW9_9PEZI|nr:trichothecene efflux pump [Lepidopterella palustris CBS 459.81]
MEKDDSKTDAYHVETVPPTSPPRSEDDFKFTIGFLSDVFALTMTGAVLLPINRDIGPSNNYTWMVLAQIVGQAALGPLAGRFGDIFGRRNFLLIGNVITIAGAAIAATAHDVNTVIGGNILLGVGGAMHQLAWTCLSELVPKRSRGLALAFFESSLLPASAFGPVIAYSFVRNGSWRPVFWLCFALDVVSLLLVFFFYWPMNQYIREEGKTTWDQVKETDFVGCFLFVAGLVLFLLGISFGGAEFPWRSAGAIAPIAIGGVLLILLGFYEAHAKLIYPCFPPVIFRNIRGVTIILIAVFLYGMAYYSTTVLFPQQISFLYTQDPLKIGWYGAGTGLGGAVITPFFGWTFRRFRRSHIQLPLLLFFLTVCSGAQAIVSPGSHIASTLLTVLIGGLVGSASIVTTAVVQIAVPHEYIGIATGVVTCVRAVGGSVATTIYASVLHSRFETNLGTDVAIPLAKGGVSPADIPQVIEALVNGQLTSPALSHVSPATLQAAGEGLKIAFAHALRVVYLVSIAFGVVGTVIGCFSANIDSLMTKHIDIKLDEGAHIQANTDTGEGHIIRHGDTR